MMRETAALVGICLIGCSTPNDSSRSSDDMARRILAESPQREAADRPAALDRAALPDPEPPSLPFEVYTWQPRTSEQDTAEIVILGKNLALANTLTIGEVEVKLTPAADGRSAVGRYPADALEDMAITLTVGEHKVALDERFTSLKREGLPRITGCTISRETAPPPARFAESAAANIGGAILINFKVEGYEPRNAPITAYIGSLVIPNDQISGSRDTFTAYVYRTQDLETGMPISIDFGHGLRVLAPLSFTLPE